MDFVAIKPYLPSIGMVLAATLGVLSTVLGDGRVTVQELLQVALMGLGAVMTYIVPRAEKAQWLKPAISTLYAVVNALMSYLTDGISSQEWVLVILAALGAVGVVVTNKQVPVTLSREAPVTRANA